MNATQTTEQTLKDGIYKSKDATYFVKDNKVIMILNGSMYKTDKNFMLGNYVEPLKPGMVSTFEGAYNKLKSW